MMELNSDRSKVEIPKATIPWRALAQLLPEFVQWYVQKYGPITEDDLDEDRYMVLRAEFVNQ